MKFDENFSLNANLLNLNNNNANNIYMTSEYLAYQSNNKYKKSIINSQLAQQSPYNLTNEDISKQFGQNNYEKSLIIISIIFGINICWYYFFYTLLTPVFKSATISILVIQLFLIIFLTYLIYRIRQNKVINTLPELIIKIIDIMCLVYLIIFFFVFVLVHFQSISIISFGYFVYVLKFSLEIYFSLLLMKLFHFNSYSYKIQEGLTLMLSYITTYLLCIEEENQQNNMDYQDCDELDSEY